MRSCPGCGLSLGDHAVFCPSCGWQQGTATQRNPQGPSAGYHAAPADVEPLPPDETDDPAPKDTVMMSRMLLGYALVPAVVIAECIAWLFALPSLNRLTHHLINSALMFALQAFLVGASALIAIVLAGFIYPPATDFYLTWWDRRYSSAPREDGGGWTLGQLGIAVVALILVLVVTLLAVSRAR